MFAMGLRRSLLPLAFALGSMLAVSSAHAGPTPKERNEAAVLTNKARAAANKKNVDEAETLFKQAEALDPQPQRRIELAKVLVAKGKLVEASKLLNGILNDASLGPQSKNLKDQAKKQLEQFETRIPWLTVHLVGPTSGARIEIDGQAVEPDAESPVDPGKHTVGVDADGFESADQDVTLKDSEHRTVTIQLEPSKKAVTEAPKSTGGTKWPAIAAFGVGAVGIGVGSVFGILAFDEAAKAKSYCRDNVCPPLPEVVNARNVSIENGNVSTVGFVVGGIGVAAGVVLLLTVGSGSTPPKKDAISVTPYVGAGDVGLVGTF